MNNEFTRYRSINQLELAIANFVSRAGQLPAVIGRALHGLFNATHNVNDLDHNGTLCLEELLKCHWDDVNVEYALLREAADEIDSSVKDLKLKQGISLLFPIKALCEDLSSNLVYVKEGFSRILTTEEPVNNLGPPEAWDDDGYWVELTKSELKRRLKEISLLRLKIFGPIQARGR